MSHHVTAVTVPTDHPASGRSGFKSVVRGMAFEVTKSRDSFGSLGSLVTYINHILHLIIQKFIQFEIRSQNVQNTTLGQLHTQSKEGEACFVVSVGGSSGSLETEFLSHCT